MPLRVLHLTGSAETAMLSDLSVLYASEALADLADPRYQHLVAHVSPDGTWRFPASLDPADLAAAEPFAVGPALALLADLHLDVAVPQMFCREGMTAYRGLLDVLGLPYLGNRPDVMALGADKSRARAVVAAAGVPVPEGEVLRRGERPTLAPATVVKPVDSDNSVGVTLVRDAAEYDRALGEAFRHADRVLVERYVELGREVRCGVLERDGDLVCLPLEEYAVDPVGKPVRDQADKLARHSDGALRLVAKDVEHAWLVPTDDPLTPVVHEVARTAHRAMGCRDYSLFDFRIDPDGRPWFLEAGLYCSFAPSSVVVMMAAAAGIDGRALFDTAVEQALRRAW